MLCLLLLLLRLLLRLLLLKCHLLPGLLMFGCCSSRNSLMQQGPSPLSLLSVRQLLLRLPVYQLLLLAPLAIDTARPSSPVAPLSLLTCEPELWLLPPKVGAPGCHGLLGNVAESVHLIPWHQLVH
jgi:hypothetical protein